MVQPFASLLKIRMAVSTTTTFHVTGTPRGQYRTTRLLTAEVSLSASISRQRAFREVPLKWRCLQGAFPSRRHSGNSRHEPISSCVELPVTLFRESFSPALERRLVLRIPHSRFVVGLFK